MLAILSSAALQGIDAELVHVEVNANGAGEPLVILVGLPDAAVKESEDRVWSALVNSGFLTPRMRTTVNLAPGSLRKEGPIYDLPIALAILVATGQLRTAKLEDCLIAGELSLSGATPASSRRHAAMSTLRAPARLQADGSPAAGFRGRGRGWWRAWRFFTPSIRSTPPFAFWPAK